MPRESPLRSLGAAYINESSQLIAARRAFERNGFDPIALMAIVGWRVEGGSIVSWCNRYRMTSAVEVL